MDILITIFAGLGLFFTGVRLLGHHLKQMTGRRLRALVTQAVAGQRSSALYGLAAGAVMQSVNAVIFLLSTLVSTGVLDTRRALPLINWANLGTSMIVIIASVDMHLAVLLLVGLTGLAHYLKLDESTRYRHWVGAMLGIGLLFLGLSLIKDSAAVLKHAHWLQDYVASSNHSVLLSFLLGVVVTLIAQSSSTITVVAMTVASAGLLDLAHGVTVVLGAGLASGISSWLLGRNLAGSARQLVTYQLILKAAGVTAMGLLLLVEHWTGWPLLMALFERLELAPATVLAAAYVLLQIACDLAIHPFHHQVEHFLSDRLPPSAEEVLGQPHFLNDQGLAEPESGLALVECEQQRLVAELPAFLNALREEQEPSVHPVEVLHRAGLSVARECDHFLTALADRHNARNVLERTIVLRERNDLITALQDTLLDYHRAAAVAGQSGELLPRLHNLTESLHMMLTLFAEAGTNPQPDDVETLKRLTYDRSDMMDGLRRQLLKMGDALAPALQKDTFACTSLFERAIWLLRRHALHLDMAAAG